MEKKLLNGEKLTKTEKDIQDFYKFRNIQEKLDAGFDFNDLTPEEQEFYNRCLNDPNFDEK